MGNNVGKIAGTVVGAACQAIPGVGTVAGIAILAATTTIGSGADALADKGKQEEEQRRVAEEDRRRNKERIKTAEKEAKDRVDRTAEEKRHADAADIKEKADKAQAQLNEEAARAIEAAERPNRIIELCREGHLMGVPALLGALSNIQFFEELGIQPIAVAPNAEVRDAIRLLLIAERNRRLPEAGEDAELAYVWFGDEADPAPAAGAAMGAGQ
jgi:hypothetical protein